MAVVEVPVSVWIAQQQEARQPLIKIFSYETMNRGRLILTETVLTQLEETGLIKVTDEVNEDGDGIFILLPEQLRGDYRAKVSVFTKTGNGLSEARLQTITASWFKYLLRLRDIHYTEPVPC